MSNIRPYFSVVLPTRNRAKLLPFAVQSVLNQTYDDFEIIISDNFSTDDTPKVAKSFNDTRIKYFRSSKSLSMGDSWEFALTHASGEYICFLSDDDAYSQLFLETIFRILNENNADIVTCKITPYIANDFCEYGRNISAQSLLILPFDRKVTMLEKKEAISFLFDKFRLTAERNTADPIIIPQLVNTACHSSIIEKIRKRVPKLFPVIGGDIYSAVLFLNAARKFCYINEPHYLQTVWERSTTSGDQSIFEQYPATRNFNYVPLKKLLTIPNYITNTVLRAKSDWGDDFQKVEIEWSGYFISSYQEIIYKQSMGSDVGQELEEFENVLSQQDDQLRRIVENSISKFKPQRERLKSKIKDFWVGKLLSRLKHMNIQTMGGLNSITEYAQAIDNDFLNKYAKPF